MRLKEKNLNLILIILLSSIIFIGRITDGGLRGDSIHYAQIAKSLLNSDNWLILKSLHKIYLNKPPLFFWLTSISLKIFGCNVFGAKFISVISAVIISILIWKISSEIYNSYNSGFFSVLLFLSNYIILRNSRSCKIESLFSLLILLGFYFLYKYLKNKKNKFLYLSSFSYGLSVLTKGWAGFLGYTITLIYIYIYDKKIKNILLSLMFFILSFIWWFIYISINTNFFTHYVYGESLNRIVIDFFNLLNLKYFKSLLIYSFHIIFIVFIVLIKYRNKNTLEEKEYLKLILIFLIIYFIGIQILKYKYDRYLYLPIIFLCIIGGELAKNFKINFKKLFISLIIILGVFYSIYPGRLGKRYFEKLIFLKKISYQNRIPIYVNNYFLNHWERGSGIYFYLDKFKVGFPKKNGIYITYKNYDCKDNILLIKNKKFKACIIKKGK